MISIEHLLAPVNGDSPTGRDASSTGLLLELESLIQGKPETQFAAGEEPNWRSVATRCLEVAAHTRDLRVGAILTAVLLRTDGLAGLHQGLRLLRGYLTQYWDTVHPRLDPADRNDPQMRLSALNDLAAPPGTDGDRFRIIEELRQIPLVESPRTGRYNLGAWLAVKGLLPWPQSHGPMPTLAILEGTRQDSDAEKLSALAAAAEGCLAELAEITALFAASAGAGNFPTFDPLRDDLRQIVAWIGKPAPKKQEDDTGKVVIGGNGVSHRSQPGEIQSRDDVLKALDAIIAYYKAHEPSSPVPFLLQRVKRVVPLNFMDMIRDLNPESLEKLIVLTGPIDGSPNVESRG